MAIPKKVINFLDKSGVKYEIIEHRIVYTAKDKAATLRIDEKIIGKTLIVKIDPSAKLGAGREYAVVLIPANKNLDKMKLKKIINIERKKEKQKMVKNIDFVKEQWMKKNLKGMKIGAIPAFGSLWNLPTFADKGLLKALKIIVNSGDYSCSIKISPANFQKLEQNLILGSFTEPKKTKKKKRKPASAKATAGRGKKSKGNPPSLKLRRARK